MSTPTAVRVIGPNGHMMFEGQEILHEEHYSGDEGMMSHGKVSDATS